MPILKWSLGILLCFYRQHPDYEFVEGRFRFDERHGNPERRNSVEPLIQTSNAILDKIDNLGLSKEFGATQGLLQNQVSKMLGSYGMYNGEDAFRTCNYRVNWPCQDRKDRTSGVDGP